MLRDFRAGVVLGGGHLFSLFYLGFVFFISYLYLYVCVF